MASYRFSASVISRARGQSAVAAAAYRSASKMHDHHHGEAQDYERKSGVLHSEIMAPEDAPDWMRDREALWNAVEAVERRKDSQLAREVQLSLPYELDASQRRELVRQFVAEQFVARGMIADLNIHAPGRGGDDRNHHAHIMLTLRELAGEGFGKKARDWNDRGNIERWREEWAQAQNLTFDRLGIAACVDHRSFEAQGIDREPQSHEGPAASGMRRKGQDSRIARENDERGQRNSDRAALHAAALRELAKVDLEREAFKAWADRKAGELDASQALTRLDLLRRHEHARDELEDWLGGVYGESLRTVQAEASALETRLSAKGVLPALRRLWSGKDDRARLDAHRRTIADTRARMDEQRGRQEAEHRADLARLVRLQEQRRMQQAEGIERAAERKEQTLAERAAEARRRAQASAPAPEHDPERLAVAERARAARLAFQQGQQVEPQGPEREAEPQAEQASAPERTQGPEHER